MNELRYWAKKNRLTAAAIGYSLGVSSTIIYRHFNGERVSDRCLQGYTDAGVPKSIVNKLRKQGI